MAALPIGTRRLSRDGGLLFRAVEQVFGHETGGNHVEDLAPDLRDACFAIGDPSGIDVHVVLHAPVGEAVTGDLHNRNSGKPDRASASRGKCDHVDTPGGEPSQRNRVIAWRIHEHKSRGGDALAVIDKYDLHHKTRAILISPAWGQIDLKQLAEWIASSRRRLRMQLQLHKYIWGPDVKGV